MLDEFITPVPSGRAAAVSTRHLVAESGLAGVVSAFSARLCGADSGVLGPAGEVAWSPCVMIDGTIAHAQSTA